MACVCEYVPFVLCVEHLECHSEFLNEGQRTRVEEYCGLEVHPFLQMIQVDYSTRSNWTTLALLSSYTRALSVVSDVVRTRSRHARTHTSRG